MKQAPTSSHKNWSKHQMTPTERQMADLQGIAIYEHAAETARLDAAYYEAIASAVEKNPAYGVYADRAADTIRRGYISICMQLLDITVEAKAAAEDYRSHLGDVA